MKKSLYLRVIGAGWAAFEYEHLADLKTEFDSRNVSVGEGARGETADSGRVGRCESCA